MDVSAIRALGVEQVLRLPAGGHRTGRRILGTDRWNWRKSV